MSVFWFGSNPKNYLSLGRALTFQNLFGIPSKYVSAHEPHIAILKIFAAGFYMSYYDKGLVHISDSALRLLLSPQLRKITQRHQILCGCKICIQDGTYQDPLNHWGKRRLIYIKKQENLLTSGSVEQLNAENISSIYSYIVLPEGNQFIHVLKMMHFPVCVTLLKIYQIYKVINRRWW